MIIDLNALADLIADKVIAKLPKPEKPSQAIEKPVVTESTVYQMPETGYIRLNQILEIIPVSRSAWWGGVKTGRFPASVKLGPSTTAWRVEDIRALMKKFAQ